MTPAGRTGVRVALAFLRLCKSNVPCSGLVWFSSVIQEICTKKNRSNESRTIPSLSFAVLYLYQAVLRELNSDVTYTIYK
jgi:hypothetical protein